MLEDDRGTSRNPVEAALAASVVGALRDAVPVDGDHEFAADSMFVVSAHYAQIRLLRRALGELRPWAPMPLVDTVDKMQAGSGTPWSCPTGCRTWRRRATRSSSSTRAHQPSGTPLREAQTEPMPGIPTPGRIAQARAPGVFDYVMIVSLKPEFDGQVLHSGSRSAANLSAKDSTINLTEHMTFRGPELECLEGKRSASDNSHCEPGPGARTPGGVDSRGRRPNRGYNGANGEPMDKR